MAAKVLNIEVGKRITKVCITEKRGKSFSVSDSFVFATPEGSVVDGQVVSEINLGDKLNEELAMRSISANEVYFSVASSKIASREVTLPAVKDDQLKNIVLTNAGDYFPVDISKYSIDSVLLERTEEECRLIVFAMPILIVDSYISLAEYCGLVVKAIDCSANSQFQVLKSITGEGVDMFITIDADSSSVNFSENGNLLMQRSLPIGGDEMICRYMAAKEIPDDEYIAALQKLNAVSSEALSEEEASAETEEEEEVEAYSPDSESGDADAEDAEGEESGSEEEGEETVSPDPFGYAEDTREEISVIVDGCDLTDSIMRIVGGISRSLDYFRGSNDKEISRVVLMGSCAHLQGLKEAIADAVGAETCWLEEVSDIQGLANSIGDISVYIGCLGARMAPLSFLPADYLQAHGGGKRKAINDQNFGYIGGGVCLLIALLLVGYSLGGYLFRKSKLEKVEAEIATLEYAEKEYNLYTSYGAAEQGLQSFVDGVQTNNASLLAFFGELEAKMPSTLSVLTASCTDKSVSLNVTCTSFKDAAETLRQLRTFETIDIVECNGVTQAEDEGASLASFTVICNYPIPEPETAPTTAEETSAEE